MKIKLLFCLAVSMVTLPLVASAEPFVFQLATSEYAVVPDPLLLSFGADGSLYTGRDASGSGGGSGAVVKIHRIAPGGAPVTEFGDVGISDPDALIVDLTGAISGTPGSVLVGGVHNDGATGKIVAIAPDGAVTTLFGPSAGLWNPSGFAFDQTGRLLITEYNGGRVLVTSGEEPAVLFSLPAVHHIAIDSLNRIVVSNGNNGRLGLYGSDGVVLDADFAQVKASTPLARGPGGEWGTDLYAVAPNGDLIRISTDGTVETVGAGFLRNSGAAISDFVFGPDGALYASNFDADRVYRFARPEVPRAETSVYAFVTDPVRLSFAPDGTLFVGRDNNGSGGDWDDAVKIHRVGAGGLPVEEYGEAAISDPDAVMYDADGSATGIPGSVIVAGHQLNSLSGKIVAIRPDQTITTLFGPTTFTFNPNAFTSDLDGRLLFSDNEGGKVWVLENGTPTVLFNLPGALHMAVDTLNRIAVGVEGSPVVRLYDSMGTLLDDAFATAAADSPLASGPGGFWGTDLFCVGANGNLLSLDLEGNAVTWGASFGLPYDMAFGPDGGLYLSEFNSDLVWKIAPPACLERPAGLIGWWPADDDLHDEAGLNHASAIGGLTLQSGMVGRALDMDGIGAFAQVAEPVGLPLGDQPRTMALWFRTSRNLAAATESALIQYGSEANGQMFGLITSGNAPGRLYFFGYSSDLGGSAPLTSDAWHHGAVTYDGTMVTLYLDGQPDGSRVMQLNTVLNANGLTIGNRPGSALWQGQLDEVMVFDRALSPEEITQLYAAGSDGVCRMNRFRQLSIKRFDDQVSLGWWSVLEESYLLQSAPTLSTPVWTDEAGPFTGTGDWMDVQIPIGPEPVRFFRLQSID